MRTIICILVVVIVCLCLQIHSLRYELSEAELSRDMCHAVFNRAGDVRMDHYEIDYSYLTTGAQ